MKLRRRWKVFWNLAALFTIIVLVRRWDPPFDDSDMWVPRDEAKPEENAYADYERIGELLEYGTHPKNEDLARILEDPAQGWPVVHALAASNRQVVAEMDFVKDKPRCQAPEIRDLKAELPGISGRLALARMLEISAASALERGDVDEASRITLIGIHYGHHVCQENETLVAFSISLAAQNKAMAMVRRVAADSEATERHLELLARIIQEHPIIEQSLQVALRGEYRLLHLHLQDAAQKGDLLGIRYLDGIPCRIPTNRYLGKLAAGTAYLPNQTRRLLHDLLKAHLEGSALPANHASLKAVRRKIEDLESVGISPRKWMRPNFVGESTINADRHGLVANSWRMTRNSTDLTRIFVAVRRYQLRHGHNPQSLNDLCPEFLDEVPVDRFDGAPIRYEATTGTIYSAWPLDEKNRPITGSWLFDKNPVVTPTEPNERTVFVLPPVLPADQASP